MKIVNKYIKFNIEKLVDLKNDKFLKGPIDSRQASFWTESKKKELVFQYERKKIIENINETIKSIETKNKNSNKKGIQKIKEDLRKKVDTIDKEILRAKQKFINIFSELLYSIIKLNKKLPVNRQLKILNNTSNKNSSNKLINFITNKMKVNKLGMIKNAFSLNKKFFVRNTINYNIEKVPPMLKMDGIIKELNNIKDTLKSLSVQSVNITNGSSSDGSNYQPDTESNSMSESLDSESELSPLQSTEINPRARGLPSSQSPSRRTAAAGLPTRRRRRQASSPYGSGPGSVEVVTARNRNRNRNTMSEIANSLAMVQREFSTPT